MHLHICDIVAHRVEMLGHRKSRSVLAYALQILTKLNSEASPGFTDVEMGASAAGYAVHEIFRHTCKMFLDGKDAFRTWFLGETIDVLPGVPTRAFTCTWLGLLSQGVFLFIGAKSPQAEELAVRDSTLAVVRMKRREMEVVVSICFLVEDRAKNLVVTTPRTSPFYLLPKIHKPNNPRWPIVSACSCPMENISDYLDEVLAPFVKRLPTYVRTLTMHSTFLILQIRNRFTRSSLSVYYGRQITVHSYS